MMATLILTPSCAAVLDGLAHPPEVTLFRRTQNDKTKTELLLFLTPQVIQNADEMAAMSRQLRGEMERLDAAVEKGLLQRHLNQLANLKVGEPVPVTPPPVVVPAL